MHYLIYLYHNNFIKNNIWSVPYYILLISMTTTVVQFLSVYYGSSIHHLIIFNFSIVLTTISFMITIYFENIYNKKKCSKYGVYVNEIDKIKIYIIHIMIYAFNAFNVFVSYLLDDNVNKNDIVSIAFILSVTFIPIIYIFIVKMKSSFHDIKNRIKKIIYNDKNIMKFYSDIEIDNFISLYLGNIIEIQGRKNSTFEEEVAYIVYEELKVGNFKTFNAEKINGRKE